MRIILPWPPSVNHYWRGSGRQRYLSPAARRYRADVQVEVALAGAAEHISEAVALDITLRPADHRVRDTDNILKALLDSLVYAGVIEDDRLVRELSMRWGCPVRPGRVEVEVRRLGYDMEQWRADCSQRRK